MASKVGEMAALRLHATELLLLLGAAIVMVIGLMVGFIVLGMFLPLVEIMTRLN